MVNVLCSPPISTRDGKIQGKRLVDEADFKADAYLGIPYAQPPIGDLRLRKPVAPIKWTDTRKCFDHGNKCIQVPFPLLDRLAEGLPASEDCLFLNVFCSGDYTQEKKRPVMVFIHGGGFACGSSKTYGDVNICDGLVRHGVIVVTIQYRLGLLGFFSTGDEVCPGNFGLWDQLEALKWVQDNIHNFGGDKENVTIFGQSAGGASVDLLSLSPKTKGLIHKVIPMAGNACASWSHQQSAVQFSTEYAETKLGVKAETSKELIDKLRQFPAEELAYALGADMKVGKNLGFTPVIDGDFFPIPLDQLRKTSPILPVMAGVTAVECALFIPNVAHTVNEDWLKMSVDTMLPKISSQEHEDVIKLFKEVARRDQPKHELWRAIVEVVSDDMFHTPTVEVLMQCAEKGVPTYMYSFNYYNPNCFGDLAGDSPARDASHCAELAFLFNAGVCTSFSYNDDDKKMAEFFMRKFANFAKRGDPNDEGEKTWLPCDTENPERHMAINLESKLENEYREGRCSRWIKLQKSV